VGWVVTAAGAVFGGVVAIRQYGLLRSEQVGQAGQAGLAGGTGALLGAAAAAGVLGGVVGALRPDPRRRAMVVAGLLLGAAGVLALLPASTATAAALPRLLALAAGSRLALCPVRRS